MARNLEESFDSARVKIIEKNKERAELIASELNNTIVINYVNDMAPTLLMYCLNYNMRKKLIDTIKHID